MESIKSPKTQYNNFFLKFTEKDREDEELRKK